MRKLISIGMLILASHSITACTDYHDELKQKIADLPPDQQRVVLAQECQKLIIDGMHSNNQVIIEHSKKMQEICEDMTGQPLHIDYPKPAE